MATFIFGYESYGMTDIMNIEKATLEDGFSLRDLYADVRFRFCLLYTSDAADE